MIFHFTAINHIISLKQPHFFYLDVFVKSSASGCCLVFAYFLANPNTMLLIKVLHIKERVVFHLYLIKELLKNSLKSLI